MSAWSDLKNGVKDGFTGRPCHVHGERYPGCPLDHIERARPSPPPAPAVDPYAQAMIADLRRENEQCKQLIAEYEEVTAAYAARPEVPAEWQQAVKTLTAERNRFANDAMHAQAAFERSNSAVAASRDMEAFFKLLGEKEMARLVHPNAHGGASPERLRLYGEAFVKLAAIYQRIGKK
jgi:hypothetical protein